MCPPAPGPQRTLRCRLGDGTGAPAGCQEARCTARAWVDPVQGEDELRELRYPCVMDYPPNLAEGAWVPLCSGLPSKPDFPSQTLPARLVCSNVQRVREGREVRLSKKEASRAFGVGEALL